MGYAATRIWSVIKATQGIPLPNEVALQRLFSMFPNGLAGAGLLLLRAVAGILVLWNSVPSILAAHEPLTLVWKSLAVGVAILILAGFWTPAAGLCIVVIELVSVFSRANGIENAILLGTVGAALALLGPGSYSLDARRYGRKRIRIPND